MKVITERDLIRTIADRWHSSYGTAFKSVHDKLILLDKETATSDDVAAIIGNNSWCSCRCHQCGNHCKAVVEVGAEEDFESHTADLCFNCVKSAFELISKEHL